MNQQKQENLKDQTNQPIENHKHKEEVKPKWETKKGNKILTFVLHSPFKFDNNSLSSQIVQERLRVNWYSLQKSKHSYHQLLH